MGQISRTRAEERYLAKHGQEIAENVRLSLPRIVADLNPDIVVEISGGDEELDVGLTFPNGEAMPLASEEIDAECECGCQAIIDADGVDRVTLRAGVAVAVRERHIHQQAGKPAQWVRVP